MEVVEDGSVAKVAIVGEGSSTHHGSNRANDIFRRRLPEILGSEKLTKILILTEAQEDEVVWNLERGFEAAKCSVDLSAEGRQLIVYKGPDDLPVDSNSRAAWGKRGLRLDK